MYACVQVLMNFVLDYLASFIDNITC